MIIRLYHKNCQRNFSIQKVNNRALKGLSKIVSLRLNINYLGKIDLLNCYENVANGTERHKQNYEKQGNIQSYILTKHVFR